MAKILDFTAFNEAKRQHAFTANAEALSILARKVAEEMMQDPEVHALVGDISHPTAQPHEPEPPQCWPAYCHPDNEFRGSKYKLSRDIADIAKDVRKGIKAAIKAGQLPKGLKTSVRIERYSMGCALNIRVTGYPVNPLNPESIRERVENPHNVDQWVELPYLGKFDDHLDTLKSMAQSYRRTNIDSASDYYDVNFSLDCGICYKTEDAWENEIKAQLAGN